MSINNPKLVKMFRKAKFNLKKIEETYAKRFMMC